MYDVVVIGLGGMGSAALAHCALRGVRALGIEQFEPLHELGASSGQTRVIRQAYYEDPAYVPLLLRAYELWGDLERRTETELLHLAGLLMVGTPDTELIRGSSLAARLYDLPVEHLDASELRRRYPLLNVRDEESGVFEARAGAIFPERAVRAHLDLARDSGAETLFGLAMQEWDADADGITVKLSDGSSFRSRSMVLTLGPWFERELRDAGVPMRVQRNVQVWFTPRNGAYGAGRFPAFFIERESLPAPLYGFPDYGAGVKAAFHGYGDFVEPTRLQRSIDESADVKPVADAVEQFMPGGAARYRAGKACMYSLTPDRHFAIDRHPRNERVVLCGGFSGHGFKFASVVGEIAAQLALDGGTRHDIGFLSFDRFTK